jgi:hypothetical protein
LAMHRQGRAGADPPTQESSVAEVMLMPRGAPRAAEAEKAVYFQTQTGLQGTFSTNPNIWRTRVMLRFPPVTPLAYVRGPRVVEAPSRARDRA